MSVVEINNLEKSFKDFTLTIPKLNIKKGFITGFIGENGSGKTTTIKLIMNMIFPDKGTIKIFNKDIKTHNEYIKQYIGYIGEYSGFFKELKLKDIKKGIAPFYKNWDEVLYKKYIELFSLNENKKYSNLSHGQKKQFDLTITLAHHPKFIIMDEPSANLDPLVRSNFIDILLEQIQNEEISIFYSSHITSDLERSADYIIFLHNGKILLYEEKDKLLETHYIVKGNKELITKDTSYCFVSIINKNTHFEGLCKDKNETFEIFGDEVIYDKASLEDILMYYINHEKNQHI